MSTAPTTHYSQLGNTTLTLLEPALPVRRVLSTVLDVSPGSVTNQGGGLHLRAQHLLDAVGAPAALAAAVMDDLDDAQRRTHTRLSFLWDEHGLVQRQTVDTQLQLDETSRYGAPDLEPLHFALESSARVLLAVIDDEWGRLLSVHLGEITELYRLENVLDTADTFRVHIMPEPDAHSLESAAEEAPRNAPVQHKSAQQGGRFHHALLAQVQRLHGVGAFEKLLIGGSVRGRADFRAQLGPDLRGTVAGELAAPGDATAAALLTAAQAALLSLEEQLEMVILDEALERGLYGGAPTLEAVQEGRVAQLLVSGSGSARLARHFRVCLRAGSGLRRFTADRRRRDRVCPARGAASAARALRRACPLPDRCLCPAIRHPAAGHPNGRAGRCAAVLKTFCISQQKGVVYV